MSTDYGHVRVGKLILKGEKPKKVKKRKKEKKERDEEEEKKQAKVDIDAINHGGWWEAKTTAGISGTVALEFADRAYLKALDNGLFTLGAQHRDGEAPDPEEIFSAFVCNETKVTFKSGYGKYVRAEKDGEVTGRSEAVGLLEQWEPIFENAKMALLGQTGCFMGIDPEDDACVALRKKVSQNETVKIRCNGQRVCDEKEEMPKEEKGNLKEIEKNYVKKFQKFQDKKLRISKNAIKELESAKKEGALHEALLDRRSKMKADRYCK